MTVRRFLATTLAILASIAAVDAASPEKTANEPSARPPSPLANATVAPALRAAAERDQVALFHLDAPGDSPLIGDSSVAWIGARDGKGARQWLIQFRRGAATEAERASHARRDKKKYLSWGPVVSFDSDVEALDLWIAGPVKTDDSGNSARIAPVKRLRVLVPADYLRLGLDDSVRVSAHVARRLEELQKEDPQFDGGGIYSLDKPIKPENVTYSKTVADKIPFTPEMARPWVGGYVALEGFYNLATEVNEIEAIASIALDKPSVWKLAKLATGTQFTTTFGGQSASSVDPAKLGLVPVPIEAFDVQFSFSFGKDPIVTGAMIVTKPLPPLDTTAGILGLVAGHPKDPNRQIHIVIISGSRGKP